MSAGRHYTVEATTPEGRVEFGGEYTADSRPGAVVADLVEDYANQTGCTVTDVTVTDFWWVSA